MRTINILNAGSDDYRQGDIVNISGSSKEFTGRFVVSKLAFMKINGMFNVTLSEFTSDNTKTDNKPKKYKNTFIKSHKKVW